MKICGSGKVEYVISYPEHASFDVQKTFKRHLCGVGLFMFCVDFSLQFFGEISATTMPSYQGSLLRLFSRKTEVYAKSNYAHY